VNKPGYPVGASKKKKKKSLVEFQPVVAMRKSVEMTIAQYAYYITNQGP
jgi:hypothetical protein